MSTGNLQKLAELAREPSSEKRRALMREVTDLFFDNKEEVSESESEHFGHILSAVSAEMDVVVRKELAHRFAQEKNTPRKLLHKLANDEIDIAEPVLRQSPALNDSALKDVIASDRQTHMRAISRRDRLSANVTKDLVHKGDDDTLLELAGNTGAEFDRASMQTMVNRSEHVPALQAPLVERKDLPPDLMNGMYDFAEDKVRKRIMQRNAEIPEDELRKALQLARQQASGKAPERPKGWRTAHVEMMNLHNAGSLDGRKLVHLERSHERMKFIHGLSVLTHIDYDTIHRILERSDIEAFALICRSLDFDMSLFVTLVVMVDKTGKYDIAKTRELGDLYMAVPMETAQRTIRFWQMRQKMQSAA